MAEINGQPAGPAVDGQLPRSLAVRVYRLPTGTLMVQLSGPIDQASGADLYPRIVEATGTGRTPPRLLLDLSGVTFLDHAGLDALLHLQEMWGGTDGAVELLTPSASVVRLLHEAELNGESWMQLAHDNPADQLPL